MISIWKYIIKYIYTSNGEKMQWKVSFWYYKFVYDIRNVQRGILVPNKREKKMKINYKLYFSNYRCQKIIIKNMIKTSRDLVLLTRIQTIRKYKV